jgi:glycosyltransferase involved in cell wall biosynthesis
MLTRLPMSSSFPAVRETFGQVILEAMASGLPVIAADQGGSAALVQHGETGFPCPCARRDGIS